MNVKYHHPQQQADDFLSVSSQKRSRLRWNGKTSKNLMTPHWVKNQDFVQFIFKKMRFIEDKLSALSFYFIFDSLYYVHPLYFVVYLRSNNRSLGVPIMTCCSRPLLRTTYEAILLHPSSKQLKQKLNPCGN